MPERHERVLVRWHCAKVKGHAELKIEKPRVKTLSYDFPKLHHSKSISFWANVHLRQSFWKTVKVTKRSCDVTPSSKYQESKGHPWPPCASNLVQFRLLFIGILVFKHTLAPSEKMADPRNFSPIRAFFLSSYRVNIARCNLCARAKVKDHIKLKIEENTSVGKLVQPFQIW